MNIKLVTAEIHLTRKHSTVHIYLLTDIKIHFLFKNSDSEEVLIKRCMDSVFKQKLSAPNVQGFCGVIVKLNHNWHGLSHNDCKFSLKINIFA